MSVRRLVLLLGDQLDPEISSLRDADPARDRILLVDDEQALREPLAVYLGKQGFTVREAGSAARARHAC